MSAYWLKRPMERSCTFAALRKLCHYLPLAVRADGNSASKIDAGAHVYFTASLTNQINCYVSCDDIGKS